jgi:pyruvate formate lyase activating enzyme
MKNEQSARSMTKREFLKCSLLAAGGCVAGWDSLRAFTPVLDAAGTPAPPMDELWKWSKEALFYTKTDNGLLCRKCPHACVLREGDSGRCRNRINYQGTMYSIAYGNPCAVHIDPIEKKPLYHFLPSTRAFSVAVAGCNLRCLNCQNWQISQFSPKETDNADLMPPALVDQCIASRCASIAYTYSEPNTFYEYGYDTAQLARKKGIKNIWKSSGYINEQPLRQLSKFLDGANIDLKCFDNSVYQRLNEARLAPVLKSLQVLHEENVWLEITNLVIPGWTDNMQTIKSMCEWLAGNGMADCPLHFSRFTPLYKLNQLPLTPVAVLDKARETAMNAGMHYVYIGNVPGHPAENTYCHQCKQLIIERKGFTIFGNNILKGRCKFCSQTIPGVWN